MVRRRCGVLHLPAIVAGVVAMALAQQRSAPSASNAGAHDVDEDAAPHGGERAHRRAHAAAAHACPAIAPFCCFNSFELIMAHPRSHPHDNENGSSGRLIQSGLMGNQSGASARQRL